MLQLLFVLLIIGLLISYRLTNCNILSAWFLSHVGYLLSVSILLWNYDLLKTDISEVTVLIIIGSILSIGLGELLISNKYRWKYNKIYYPSKCECHEIKISSSIYWGVVFLVLALLLYNYYSFTIIGSYLGGGDFVSNYVLMRSAAVQMADGEEMDLISVPFSSPMAYLNFFVEILVYFFIYLYFYHRSFKIKPSLRSNYWYLVPAFLYFFVSLLSTSRSEFIKLLTVIGMISFVLQKQANNGWHSRKSNRDIAEKALLLGLAFAGIFSLVGLLKDQNVKDSFDETLCSYAGASVIGLDRYVNGQIKNDRKYIGQETFMNFYSALNKLGFKFEKNNYHQEFFIWGKCGESSNIYSSPYYFMIDFPIVIVFILYFLIGMLLAWILNSIKFGTYHIHDIGIYIFCAILYYPIIMISITEAFHHFIGSRLVYQLFSVYIINRLIVRRKKNYQ